MYVADIDTDIPFAPFPPSYADLRERVDAAFRAIAEVATEGVQVSEEDISAAHAVLADPTKATEKVLSSPGAVVQIKALLSEYDHLVVQSAAQIRTYVTNRLIQDSSHPDARIRIRCYELLGKISDVGLFTEKTEITMRQRPTAELEQLLRERLMKTIDAEQAEIVAPAPVVPTQALPMTAEDLEARLLGPAP
jgi:hypothetical protein